MRSRGLRHCQVDCQGHRGVIVLHPMEDFATFSQDLDFFSPTMLHEALALNDSSPSGLVAGCTPRHKTL